MLFFDYGLLLLDGVFEKGLELFGEFIFGIKFVEFVVSEIVCDGGKYEWVLGD